MACKMSFARCPCALIEDVLSKTRIGILEQRVVSAILRPNATSNAPGELVNRRCSRENTTLHGEDRRERNQHSFNDRDGHAVEHNRHLCQDQLHRHWNQSGTYDQLRYECRTQQKAHL